MRKVRLFIDQVEFHQEGQEISLPPKQAHYVQNVMRVKDGDNISVFNGSDGLWSASISYPSKKTCVVTLASCLNEQPSEKPVHLHFAPLKQAAQAFLIEKATELGVTHFNPILTERTVVRAFKADKNHLTAIEASEQCERLSVPDFSDLTALEKSLKNISPATDVIYVCDERLTAKRLIDCLSSEKVVHLVIGPEGGFSPYEFQSLERHPAVQFVALNSNVLRAETAALCALSILKA